MCAAEPYKPWHVVFIANSFQPGTWSTQQPILPTYLPTVSPGRSDGGPITLTLLPDCSVNGGK